MPTRTQGLIAIAVLTAVAAVFIFMKPSSEPLPEVLQTASHNQTEGRADRHLTPVQPEPVTSPAVSPAQLQSPPRPEAMKPSPGFSSHSVSRRLADATVISERLAHDADTVTRTRLLKHHSQPYLLRLVETVDTSGSEPRLTQIAAMAADQLVVSLDHPSQAGAVRSYAEARGYTVRASGSPYLLVIQLAEATLDAVPEAMADLAGMTVGAHPPEPNYLRFPTLTPNDLQRGNQYALELMDAFEAWDVTTGSREVILAVIDSGIDIDHPDLQPNLWVNPGEVAGNGLDDDGNGVVDDIHGWNYFQNNADVNDIDSHGSHVAGIAGAVGNNITGVTGVNWQVGLIAMRAGNATFDIPAIVSSLDYIADLRNNRGINVVVSNHSYGGPNTSSAERAAVQRQQSAGILFVAAAGNDGDNVDTFPSYPGAFTDSHIINVAATDARDYLWVASNYGDVAVDLGAPGVGIYSTVPGGTYVSYNGTSMASPQVAGAIALGYAARPELTWQEMRTKLLDSVAPVGDLLNTTVTGGRLDLGRFMAELFPPQQVEIISPVEDTHLTSLSQALVLQAAVTVDEQSAAPENPVTWSVTPATGVTLTPQDDTSAAIQFSQPGIYEITATLVSANGTTEDTRTVGVGDFPAEVDNGLVAEWLFDGTGATVTDTSGNGLNGTLQSGATRAAGISGTAFSGLGSGGQRVSIPSMPPLNQLSISAWVKADGPGAGIPSFPRILANSGVIFYLGFSPTTGSFNNLKFGLYTNTTTLNDIHIWHTPINSILQGDWYHVAVAYDGIDNARLYINGKPQEATRQTTGVGPRIFEVSPAYIGNNGAATRGFEGQIDELRVYNRTITDDEVSLLAFVANDAPVIGDPSGLAATLGQPWQPVLTVTDTDGPSALGYLWEVVAGPAGASIANASSLNPSFTFPQGGSYTVRLTAGDGNADVAREWQVDVTGTTVTITTADSAHLLLAGNTAQVELALDPAPDVDLAVNLSAAGTAVAGTDYMALPASVTVDAGQTAASFPVNFLTSETGNDRTLAVSVAEGADYGLGADTGVTFTLHPYTFGNWSAFYESGSGLPPERWTTGADANNNGVSNLVEFALGLNPLNSDLNALTLRLPRIAHNAAGKFVLTYVRPLGADPSRYTLGASEVPGGTPFVPFLDQGRPDDNNDGTETVTAYEPMVLPTAERRFIFLRVDDTPATQ